MILIKNYNELDKAIVENKDSLMLLYFGATWCDPCMKLKEQIIKNKDEIKNLIVMYIDCDIEENEDILQSYKVSTLPTQIFIHLNKNNVINDYMIKGYDWIQLIMKYNELNNNTINT